MPHAADFYCTQFIVYTVEIVATTSEVVSEILTVVVSDNTVGTTINAGNYQLCNNS